MLIYGVISLFSLVMVLYSSRLYILSVLLIAASAWGINGYLNSLFLLNKVKGKKYFSGKDYLRKDRYMRFRKLTEEEFPKVHKYIPKLLEWDENRLRNYQRVKLMTHPFTLVVLGGVLGVLSSSSFISEFAAQVFMVLILGGVIIIMLLDVIVEFMAMKDYAVFEVNRFLKWMLIEKEVASIDELERNSCG